MNENLWLIRAIEQKPKEVTVSLAYSLPFDVREDMSLPIQKITYKAIEINRN